MKTALAALLATILAALVLAVSPGSIQAGDETQIPGAAGDADYWPPGYVPLAEYCPEEGDIHAEWSNIHDDDPNNIGEVEFRRDGTSVWSKHGTIPYRIPPGEWVHPVLELLKPLSGQYRDQGPYVLMIYPYLSVKGSGSMCQMYMILCPTLEDTRITDMHNYYDANCERGYDFMIWRP